MSNAGRGSRRATSASKALVIVLVGIFAFAMAGFVLAVIDAPSEDAGIPSRPSLAPFEPTPESQTDADAATVPQIRLALAEPESTIEPAASPSGEPAATHESLASPGVPLTAEMPVVPIASFWSKEEGVARRDVVSALESGRIKGFKRVVVQESIADPLAELLGIQLGEPVQLGDLAAVEKAVRRGGLGLVAAADLSPSTRALKLSGQAIVGSDRIGRVEDWPLRVSIDALEGSGWDHDRTWVLVAGGDSFTDRGVYDTVVRRGKGVDYPFDGGTAKVTGYGCCDPVFNDNVVPRYVLTGNKGAVRKLFKSADLAIANHEQPVTEAAVVHDSGTRFSGKPALTSIFTRAGIDYLSLANNHIKDYGADGIKDTRRILRQNEIAFGGAGKDLAQARKIAYLKAGDSTLAIIPCLGIVKIYWAEPKLSGATPCLDRYIVPDIKQAKRKADAVIVFPHWGVEYTRQPLPSMRRHAKRWAKAGADLVLGGHSHVAGAIEEFDGTPVLYSLGNLIFDQHWSTNTMQSALLEATFHGSDLVELRLRPYIIHNTSQPNFLDPAQGAGRQLLKSIQQASSDWLDW
jgi:poly-gamma-glutamate capsule biosynthesis protein CapA/YwtB (metallophosphatase superfamily)